MSLARGGDGARCDRRVTADPSLLITVPHSELVYWLQRNREVDDAGEAIAEPVAAHTESSKVAQPYHPVILVSVIPLRISLPPRAHSSTLQDDSRSQKGREFT